MHCTVLQCRKMSKHLCMLIGLCGWRRTERIEAAEKGAKKKATKHHKCGTPIMNLLISYFGVGILKFVGQHLDTQGLSAEPSMKNRINSNSTAWYRKVRVQEDFQKMAHVYLMSSAFLLIPFWQQTYILISSDIRQRWISGTVMAICRWMISCSPLPAHICLSTIWFSWGIQIFKLCQTVSSHWERWNRITVLATTIWTSCFKGWLWIVRWGSICCTVEYALLVTKWLPYKESAL